ncbi:MAG: hypothetical protein LBI01_04280 [Elusimicrobium sp.]|jgi:hypothetical protein|nr:hypothetical protein [Elusimicrobium sp.]
MKLRLLILTLCLIPLFACDKTPKPADNAAARDMFAQIDKNFNAAMLPLDKYFEINGLPDEIRDFRNTRNNYNAEIKNALLQTGPAAQNAALKAADDKYIPRLNALQNRVKQRAANDYAAGLENQNAAARAAARKVFGPQAEAEVKSAQDKMMNEIKTALTDPDPRSAFQRVENAGNNFKNDLENTVNKYAARQNTPPEQALKVFEPYNNNAPVSASARPAPNNYYTPQAVRPTNIPRPQPSALNNKGSGLGGAGLSASSKTSGGLPDFINNYKPLPQETSDAGGLAGQDFLSKIQNDIKTFRENTKPTASSSSAGPALSGRPGSGGGAGQLMAYLPADKVAEVTAELDNDVKTNYPKLKELYGEQAAEKYKQIVEKYKKTITETGPVTKPANQKNEELNKWRTDFITESSANSINTDYDYRAKLFNAVFEELKAAAPDSSKSLTQLQNETNKALKNAKDNALSSGLAVDTDGKITGAPGSLIIPADTYGKEANKISTQLAAALEPLIKQLQNSGGAAQAAGAKQ